MTRRTIGSLCLWVTIGLSVVVFGLFLSVPSGAHEPADPESPTACVPGPHSGAITASEEWCQIHSPHLVTGDTTVQNGAVLTIEPGVTISFAASTGLYVGNLVSSGKLVAEGTSSQPITFTAYSTDLPGRGYWDGIELSGNSPANVFRYCVIEYAGTGVFSDDSDNHIVDHCTFRHNGDGADLTSGGALNIDGDTLAVTDNEMYDNELGLRLRKSNYNVITNNHIYDNDHFGIGFVVEGGPGGGDNTIDDNQIHDNGDDGLYLDSGANNVVTGNQIYGNGGDGLWARNQDDFQVIGNVVRANGQNGFTYATPNDVPDAIHSNVFCSNTGFELQNLWGTTLTAEGNWFGTNNPGASEIDGLVDFDPWIEMDVSLVPDELPADGASTADLTLTMIDGIGHAVPDGYTVNVSASEGSLFPSLLTLSSGQGTSTYTAGTTPGDVEFLADDGCATLSFTAVLTLQTYLDLAVSKTVDGLTVGPNKDYFIEYTVTVSNVGQITATDAVLTDVLPAEATYEGSVWTCAGGECTYAVGTLVPSETMQLSLPVKLDRSALDCPIVLTNVVHVADHAVSGDIDPTNNVFTLTSVFECLPDLVVVLNDNVGPTTTADDWVYEMLGIAPENQEQRLCVVPGEWITYTIGYVNTGLVPATQVVLTETVPDHTSYMGYDWTCVGDTCTRSLGTLGPDTGGVAHFAVQVDTAPLDLRIEDQVRIGAAEEDLYPPDNVSYDDTPICEGAPRQVYLPLIIKGYTPPEPPPPPPPEVAYVSDVAVNPETNRVYIASPQLDAVFAVDPTGSGSIVATIPVGDHPLGLAVVTTTNKIYAANFDSWTLTAIRGSDHTRLTDIYVGAQACKAAADSGDARVYVTNHLESDNGAAAINSQTDTFLYYYSRLHATQGRYGIDVDTEQEKLFIAARDAGLIAIQDAYLPDHDPQVFKLDPPRVPYVVAWNPTTQHLFVTAADDNLVVVLDPYSIQWSRGRWILERGRWVFLLDWANAGWIKEIGVGQGAEEGIALNPLTGYVYVTNADNDTVSIIQDDADPANIQWIMDLAVGDYPQGVDVDVLRNYIYVGNAESRDLTVIDGATHTVDKTIPLD